MAPKRRGGLRMPTMRIPVSAPIRPVFTPDQAVPNDFAFEQAASLYDQFEPLQGERSATSMKWGDVRSGQNCNVAVGNAFDVPWIDIGPFDEPTEIEINMLIDPDPRNLASGGLPLYVPNWQWKAIIGVGLGKLEKRVTLIQPRVFTCQSLTLFAADPNNQCIEPYRVAIYASRWRASTFPRPIGVTHITMGIGTALAGVDMPPREATHLMVGRGSLSNMSMGLRVQSGSGAVQEFTVNSGSGTVAVPNPIFPIVPDANVFQITRSSSAAADTYSVWWLR